MAAVVLELAALLLLRLLLLVPASCTGVNNVVEKKRLKR